MVALLLILCTHNGAETLRATVQPGTQVWRARTSPGWTPTGLWKTATMLAQPTDADVLLVVTDQPEHGSAAFIVNAAECTVTP